VGSGQEGARREGGGGGRWRAWLRADGACTAVVRRRTDADRDCHGSVRLADERVPHCECLSNAFTRRLLRAATPPSVVAVARGAPQCGGLAREGVLGLRVVPHAVALCS